MPSLAERAREYEAQGLGKASEYKGSPDQNPRFLKALLKPKAATPNAVVPAHSKVTSSSDIFEYFSDVAKKLKSLFLNIPLGHPAISCPLYEQSIKQKNQVIDPSEQEKKLNLGPNEIYREDLLFASKRTQIDPAALAALIDAEAAKDGKVWNPNSKAKTSSATGLTQFLDGTWIEMAAKPGTYLNEDGKKLSYIDKNNKIVDKKKILELRTNPRHSITAAAEYGKQNLAGLDKKGLVPEGTNDDEKAKLMYLAHHEGLGGATKFLNDTTTNEEAVQKLPLQVGKEKAEKMLENGNAKDVYKDWLNSYINKKIDPSRFRSPTPVQPPSIPLESKPMILA